MRRTIDEKDICQMYLNGEYLKDIADKYGYSTTYTIKQILTNNHIPLRNQRQNTGLRNHKNAKKKNISYFNKETHNMAWLLGFIAADGCIYRDKNQIKIGLSSIDREILEKIKDELQIENKICDYVTNQGFNVSELRWTCQEHKQKLMEYGIVANKTFCLGIPYKLNKVFWIDYIRGLFDGDGSINYIHSNNSIRWQICSATPEILEWIVNFLYDEYNIPKVNIQTWQRKENYTVFNILKLHLNKFIKFYIMVHYALNGNMNILQNLLMNKNSTRLHFFYKKKRYAELIRKGSIRTKR